MSEDAHTSGKIVPDPKIHRIEPGEVPLRRPSRTSVGASASVRPGPTDTVAREIIRELCGLRRAIEKREAFNDAQRVGALWGAFLEWVRRGERRRGAPRGAAGDPCLKLWSDGTGAVTEQTMHRRPESVVEFKTVEEGERWLNAN